jgi:Zn-dependent peptidase ImmA (M78 family)
MTEFVSFGSPEQFEIAARWSSDREPRERLPLNEGWSTGDLRITVGRQVLTQHTFGGVLSDHLSWYLSPIVEWLLDHWSWLFHEESYAWLDKSGQPAAVATFSALERTISSPDERAQDLYGAIHAWWSRHALRAADSSAVYPDIYFRRVADDVEISWLARQPEYAPEGFWLTLAPGYALLPIAAVAEPLWQFLEWALRSAPASSEADRTLVSSLGSKLAALRKTPASELELRYVGQQVQQMLDKARKKAKLRRDSSRADDIPVIESLDSAVLMFGGLNVDVSERDVLRLVSFLADRQGGSESDELSDLVSRPATEAWALPHEEGYRLAEDIRDELRIEREQLYVDIEDVLRRLNVDIVERALDTDSIRGVAIAGNGFAPAILVNTTSAYNCNDAGKRFTLAHELCHILFDRTRARKLSHLSGAWAPARTEKRANAFAAMFLASTVAVRRSLCGTRSEDVHQLASEVGMGFSALVEHLFNVDVISDAERERLRQRWE